MLGLFILVTLIAGCSAEYPPGPYVVKLTPDDFDARVIESNKVWVVQFYSPSNSDCVKLYQPYMEIAENMVGLASFAVVNVDEHASLSERYKVERLPTILVFANNKNKPEEYKGPFTRARLVDGILDIMIKADFERKYGSTNLDSSKNRTLTSYDLYPPKSNVVHLTSSNFDSQVMLSKEIWIVQFYSPSDSDCVKFAISYTTAANFLLGLVNLGAVNTEEHGSLEELFDVRRLPTILIFGDNKFRPKEYQKSLSLADVVEAALEAKIVNRLEKNIGKGNKLGSGSPVNTNTPTPTTTSSSSLSTFQTVFIVITAIIIITAVSFFILTIFRKR